MSEVRHVLFYVALKPGNLMLVEMDDHTLAILRDDVPLAGFAWEHISMSQAVAEFQKLKSELTAKHGHSKPNGKKSFNNSN
jgi:hypothetical protein